VKTFGMGAALCAQITGRSPGYFFILSIFSAMLIQILLEVLGFIVIEDILDKNP
jgi:hypothetical protein